jgi:four helix bundle protein
MQELIKKRTKQIGLEVIKLVDELPSKTSTWEISKQIIRCSTSIGANYRSSCRAMSAPDFINKLKIVEEEADETLYWLEIIQDSGLSSPERLNPIRKETDEILSIIVASLKTLRNKLSPNDKS